MCLNELKNFRMWFSSSSKRFIRSIIWHHLFENIGKDFLSIDRDDQFDNDQHLQHYLHSIMLSNYFSNYVFSLRQSTYDLARIQTVSQYVIRFPWEKGAFVTALPNLGVWNAEITFLITLSIKFVPKTNFCSLELQ